MSNSRCRRHRSPCRSTFALGRGQITPAPRFNFQIAL
jgi:hypothetical protein